MAKVTPQYILAVINPTLAAQWLPTRNGILSHQFVAPSSGRKVFWLCPKSHEWEATVANRIKGRGCPFSAGKKALADTCLETFDSHIAGQWHPSKNGDLTPRDVTRCSSKKVWWQCHGGHAWKATISNRTGNGCPVFSQEKRRSRRLHAPANENPIANGDSRMVQTCVN